jgi:hypothetical protein
MSASKGTDRTDSSQTAEERLGVGLSPQISAAATLNPPDFSALAACTDEARRAALDPDRGPGEPADFHSLRGRLEALRDRIPPAYRDTVFLPFTRKLDQLGISGYSRILVQDPNREGLAGLLLDIAQALLQQGESYAELATDAFEEVVSDLYDGFLSAEDRRGVLPPDRGTLAPLVKWGNPDFGPYTWPVDATASFGVQAAVVSMPPAHARKGLVAWGALAHETAGHDIQHADTGLLPELADSLHQALGPLGFGLADYWAERIDETASDVVGILNMGPAAGIALVSYFRALNAAYGGDAALRSEGPSGDPHPADVLRGYLAAETVSLLRFSGHTKWASAILEETQKDAGMIVLAGTAVTSDLAYQSAKAVARTLVLHKSRSLEQHALGDIQNWTDPDERKVKALRRVLRTASALPAELAEGLYAAHVVAAAIVEALSGGADIALLFERALALLKVMHDRNPVWGPLYVRHRGDIARDFAYVRSRAAHNGEAVA